MIHIFICSLNSGDQRGVMSRVLKGSSAELPPAKYRSVEYNDEQKLNQQLNNEQIMDEKKVVLFKSFKVNKHRKISHFLLKNHIFSPIIISAK